MRLARRAGLAAQAHLGALALGREAVCRVERGRSRGATAAAAAPGGVVGGVLHSSSCRLVLLGFPQLLAGRQHLRAPQRAPLLTLCIAHRNP